MILQFSERVAELPPVWVCAVHGVFRERLSIYMCSSFRFGFEGDMSDLIVLIHDRCLSFFFYPMPF